MRELGIAQPHIAVAGLNPHAGEHGLDHVRFDYPLIAQHARVVVDTRHAFAERGLGSANVVDA